MKYLSSGVLAACFSLLIGVVLGAATQRWGDADRATHGHKYYSIFER